MNRLTIEWRHLDVEGNTCERCSNTGASVRSACEILAQELGPPGWQLALKEVLLDGDEIPESNMVLVNGIPMEQLLSEAEVSENCCESCGEILGTPTRCRIIERQGRTYEAIPVSLILEAVHNYIQTINK
jgi:hypothetical protein